MISPIVDLLIRLLTSFRDTTGSYGWAIVLLTLAVKLALHPLTRIQLNTIKAMKAITPQLTALRERYRDDPRALRAEVSKLYRAHKIYPLSFVVPLLAQLPVVWALFAAILHGLASGERFLGVRLDQILSFAAIAKEPLLAIYPVLVGVVTYLDARISGDSRSRMTILIPVVVVYFAMHFPVALSIYWIVSTLVHLLEYFIVVGRPLVALAGAPLTPKAPPQVRPH